jgi:RHS repeat-associated protein
MWHEYSLTTALTSVDGRSVLVRKPLRDHTWVWNQSQSFFQTFVPAFIGGAALGNASQLEVAVTTTEVMTTHQYDPFGNEIAAVDYGIQGVDQPILRSQTWNLPPGDTSGWNFRLTSARLGYSDPTGATFTGAVREHDYQYTAQGLVQDAFGVLSGTLALPAPAGGRAAAQPADASQNGSLHLHHVTYDGFGNVLTDSTELNGGGAQRCTAITPDSLYAQYPASTTVYPGGCGSSSSLVTSAQFDRRFGVPVSTLSPAGRLTVRKYDDFGRVTELDQPDAVTSGLSAVAMKADYDDTPPVRRVHSQTVNGPDAAPSFVDHYTYIDGFGGVMERIDEASPSSGSTPRWIASKLHTYYATGLALSVFKPFYVPSASFPGGAGPAAAPAGQLPVTAGAGQPATFTYDNFGRLLISSDFDGQLSTRQYHSALSFDMFDPEQASGSHRGAFTTAVLDGHGRLIQTLETVAASSHGSGIRQTTLQYLATGEATSITQTFPGGPSAGISRTMQYDSLGRLVQVNEPNSGISTFAYNDIGEVVGTSDARGCGENIYHDGIGRLVAEDYSPCSSSQAAYTAPNAATGAGTESFYLYDSPPGALTASWDLGQHSVYSYDARGRVTGIARQITVPSTAGAPPPSSTGLAISGTLVDAQGNPMVGITVTLSGRSQAVAHTDVDGQYSFGGLVSGASYSILPTAPANCTLKATTVDNLNRLTASQNASFMGVGAGCGGTPTSSPIPVMGNLVISGVITNASGAGIEGIEVDLNGSFQATTHTDSSGFYSFSGLASGSGQNYSLNPNSLPAGCTVSPGAINNVRSAGTTNFTASGSCPTGLPAVGGGLGGLDGHYAPHVFGRTFIYDAANRLTSATTGADLTQLEVGGASAVGINYLLQGGVASVSSSYGALLASQQLDASGAPVMRVFGDAAGTTETRWYDQNEQLLGLALQRAPGSHSGAWTTYSEGGAPTAGEFTLQTVLANEVVTYDRAGNPLTTTQSLTPFTNPNGVTVPGIVAAEWPSGAMPVASRVFGYGDDYRLQTASTEYVSSSGNDAVVSPYSATETENAIYPAQAPVSTHNRTRSQSFAYDWRGNLTSSADDASVFFDRSLGTVLSGSAGGVSGPDQLGTAQLAGATAQAQYDAAGNLTAVSDSLTGASYAYSWDEVGRLATASRTDAGERQPALVEHNAYDAGGQRIRTTRQTAGSNPGVDHTVQVFDSLVLEHAAFPSGSNDYERDAKTVNAYLGAGSARLAHVTYDVNGSLPAAASGNGRIHTFMLLGDRLSSTSTLIDHDSGELVERLSYLSYGGVDSDYRPARWDNFREDLRYNGHWDDASVGLIYYQARFYSPQLARFISPDQPGAVGAGDPLGLVSIARAFNLGNTSPLRDGTAFGDPRLDTLNPYIYCGDNPTGLVDPNGRAGLWAAVGGGIGGAIGGGLGTYIGAKASNAPVGFFDVAVGAGAGFIGGFIGGFLSPTDAIGVGALVGGFTSASATAAIGIHAALTANPGEAVPDFGSVAGNVIINAIGGAALGMAGGAPAALIEESGMEAAGNAAVGGLLGTIGGAIVGAVGNWVQNALDALAAPGAGPGWYAPASPVAPPAGGGSDTASAPAPAPAAAPPDVHPLPEDAFQNPCDCSLDPSSQNPNGGTVNPSSPPMNGGVYGEPVSENGADNVGTDFDTTLGDSDLGGDSTDFGGGDDDDDG